MEEAVSFNPIICLFAEPKNILNFITTLFSLGLKDVKVSLVELEGYGLKEFMDFLQKDICLIGLKYTKLKLMPIVFKTLSDFDKN